MDSRRSTCKEADLLLALLRAEPESRPATADSNPIPAGIDWPRLLALAECNRVGALLYRQITAMDADVLPQEALADLREIGSARSLRNLTLTGELLKVLRGFAVAGIGVVPYKGPVLASMLYESLAFREFGDIDLLIHAGDIGRASSALLGQGYGPAGSLTPGQEQALVGFESELAFYHPGRDVLIELHWNFRARHYYFPIDPQLVRSRLQPAEVMKAPVRTLSDEDLFLLLCVSGAGHGWRFLSLIFDVAALIKTRPEMDWQEVSRLADRLECRRMLQLGLFLAHDLLGTTVPPGLVDQARADRTIVSLAREARDRMCAPAGEAPRLSTQASFYLRACDTPWAAVRFLARNLFAPTSRDIAWISLPPSLCLLYFAVRPVRLITSCISRLISPRRQSSL